MINKKMFDYKYLKWIPPDKSGGGGEDSEEDFDNSDS